MIRNVVLAYHEIGAICLEELLATGDEVALVVTHEDSPGENRWFRSVRDLARSHGLRVIAPHDVNCPESVEEIRACEPDFLFSFLFRQILCPELLKIPKLGALNLHPSALPKFRGRSPLNWALVEGARETGVTLHYMVEKPDRGDIVAQRRFPIFEEDTALSLYWRAAEASRELLRETYPLLREGRAPRIPQDPSQASYYGGRRPEDGELDWTRPARRLYDLVRAVTHPWPGAFTWRSGRKVFVWWARPVEEEHGLAPGEVGFGAEGQVYVGTGRGSLRLERVQEEGGEEKEARDWARDAAVLPGERLGRNT